MRIAITGGHGFLGWHTAVRLRALYGVEPILVGHGEFTEERQIVERIRDADSIIHLAGVNRAEHAEQVESGNIEIARVLGAAIVTAGRPRHIVYANSIQSDIDNPYGRGKAGAADILRSAVAASGGTFADVVLPNIFGEHGRPNYNSFIATFCHEVVAGRTPEVIEDAQIQLLHAQLAADHLIDAAMQIRAQKRRPCGQTHSVRDVLNAIREFHGTYSAGQIPELNDQFSVDLFNTYRSFTFPQLFPFASVVNSDERGELYETVRVHGGTGQTFVSSTVPGAVRGEHYHLRKVERFYVLKGTAEISLRCVLTDRIVRFHIKDTDHSFVDMPTMWVHNIRNVGDDELLTMFWSDQLFNSKAPDTYREQVDIAGRVA